MSLSNRILSAAAVAAGTFVWAVPAPAQDGTEPTRLERAVRDYLAANPSLTPAILRTAGPAEPAPTTSPAPLAEDEGAGGKWEMRGTAWAYTTDANVSMDTGGAGAGAHFDADYGESIFTGVRLEVMRNRLGALLEVEWTDTTAEDDGTDLDLESRRVDLGGIFRILGADNDGKGLVLDVFGGGRYWYTREDISGSGSDHDDWWEPFFGAETRIPVPILVNIVARLQTSGYAMGNSTLNADLTVAAEFSIGPVSLQLGWRFHQVRYDVDSDTEADVTQNGPFVGVGFGF